MFRRSFVTALIAGAIAGLFAFGLHAADQVDPSSFRQADIMRRLARRAAEMQALACGASVRNGRPEGACEPAYTVLGPITSPGSAFALLLVSAVAWPGCRSRGRCAARLLWLGTPGVSAVFRLRPARDSALPPGAEVAELASRQIWWVRPSAAHGRSASASSFLLARLVARVYWAVAVLRAAATSRRAASTGPRRQRAGDIVAQFRRSLDRDRRPSLARPRRSNRWAVRRLACYFSAERDRVAQPRRYRQI